MSDPFFRFESDFVESLRCIPMAVRLRLDVTGVKLKLNEWSKLNPDQRLSLVRIPFGTSGEVSDYRGRLSSLVADVCGSPPSLLPELPEPEWENSAFVPEQVNQQALAVNLQVTPADWSRLTSLQRFALIKLSRPGHENRNFVPAMVEFGLA